MPKLSYFSYLHKYLKYGIVEKERSRWQVLAHNNLRKQGAHVMKELVVISIKAKKPENEEGRDLAKEMEGEYGPYEKGLVGSDFFKGLGWDWIDSLFSRADGSKHRDRFQIRIRGVVLVAVIEPYRPTKSPESLPRQDASLWKKESPTTKPRKKGGWVVGCFVYIS